MSNILNINGVDICANILDLDTVLQGNIFNVNSVPVECGWSGGSWDCSATTIYDSCSGATAASCTGCGGTPTSESAMSNYFSEWGANQGLQTTDYYYLDYTASTTSTSCTEKGSPKRQLLGWSIDINPPGNALYSWPGVGGGIIHDGWSTFLIALNSTPYLVVPPNLDSAQLDSHLAGLTPTPTYSPIFKDCKCYYDCNCIPISGSSGAYSSMTQCLGDDDTCCAECEVKSIIELAKHDSDCEAACVGVCEWYWTDVASPVPCPLSLGDHIYIDAACTPAPIGFYSPNNCDAACGYCYEVGPLGEVIGITLCDEESCKEVELFSDSDGLPCPLPGVCEDPDCNVCKFDNRLYFYTDALGTPPILMVGDHLYKDLLCICEINALSNLTMGMYLWKDTTQGTEFCITLGHECMITSKTLCVDVPDSPPPIDEEGEDEEEESREESSDDGEHGADKPDKDWSTDEETGHAYYDEAGYRYYDENGDGIADYSIWIGYEGGGDGPEEVVP